jgi:sn-glycerol 3-phosphate transport system permease protein
VGNNISQLESKISLQKVTSFEKTGTLETINISKLKENVIGYLFLSPSIILFTIFLFYPLAKSVYLSLFITDPRGKIAEFVGIQNYINLFTSDQFFTSLKVTVLFALLTVPSSIVFALVLSLFTHNRLKGMRIFQFIFSLPIAISVGTASIIWMILFHPSAGMFNYFLNQLGFQSIFWLSDPKWALFSISLVTVWMNLGFNYIVLLSGLQGISEDLYESARIDGAGRFRILWNMTLPLLSPTIFFVSIVSIIGAFQAFGQIHIMTKGGPIDSTNVFVYSLYQEAFINFNFGSGSASAIVLFAIILSLTFIQFKITERKVHYQ